MPPKSKPYEQFGPFILFKKFESNPLGDVWRAAKIEGQQLGPAVAVHRLSGGNREGIRRSVEWARPIAPALSGTTVAKQQMIDIIDGIPFVAHEYDSGRSLSYVIEKSRGGAGNPNPVPLDQALAILDKVANSVETIHNMKYQGTRLIHGSLIPQFVWIESDGEIRVAGQQIGKGLLLSLNVPDFGKAFSPYVAPEIRDSQQPTRASDVFSLGALLYLVLTGSEPPDPLDAHYADKIAAAKSLVAGGPVPADIMPILKKATELDPSKRYPSATELRGAISPLVNGGSYTATTFNLAFYLSSLLRKELDGEAADREKEAKIPLAPYLEDMTPAAAVGAAPAARPAAPAAAAPSETKSRMPLIAAAAVAVVAIGAAGAWFAMSGKKPTPPPRVAPSTTSAPVQPATTTIQPIIESVSTATTTATTETSSVDPEAQKKAFEAAVNKKLQEEMMKLQQDYNKQLERQKKIPPAAPQTAAVVPRPAPATAPAQTAPPPVVTDTRPAPSAAALDQRLQQQAAATATAPATVAPAPVTQTAAVAAPPAVQEGDLVSMNELDQAPRLTRRVAPVYPPIAAQRKMTAQVILSVLVSSNGSVEDLRVLRGDKRGMGFDDAATRAVHGWKFTPGVKDGKHVRVWIPVAVDFKP